MLSIVAREKEQQILQTAFENEAPQLIAVYGRRRIGKTYLINSFFSGKLRSINLIGSKRLNTASLLKHFQDAILQSGISDHAVPLPQDWNDAFRLLKLILKGYSEPLLLFIDEVPWFDKPRSNFLGEFEHFWNTWAAQKNNLKIVLCGSASSWMLKKLIYNKEGLHNRFTARINLKPFSIIETKNYLESRGVHLLPQGLLELYLSIGGVAEYLNWIQSTDSTPVIVQKLCFNSQSNLLDEYEALIPALFSKADKYEALIGALSAKRQGITIEELESRKGIAKGTTLKRMLKELELNSFVTSYVPFAWGKRTLYRLSDPYLLFYHKWIKEVKKLGTEIPENYWQHTFNTQSFRIWLGYSYETFCFTHVSEILVKLGISGMRVLPSVWRSKRSPAPMKGAQIDLVLERADKIVNVCEIKCHAGPIALDANLEQELYRKASLFQEETGIRHSVVPVLISSSQVINKGSSIRYVDGFGVV